ncbi:MAG: hypothetical protein IPJ74_24820 [Saprospiraceae bacterium]|nr:hypothetical protein [Saprospiraceae bacterium]
MTLRKSVVPIKLLSRHGPSSRQIIRRFEPDVAVGVGGYASGRCSKWQRAWAFRRLFRSKILMLARQIDCFRQKCRKFVWRMMAWSAIFQGKKLVLTGNPVRRFGGYSSYAGSVAIFYLDLNKKTFIIFGGSLGARTLNQAMAASTE